MNKKELGRKYAEKFIVSYQVGEEIIENVFDLMGEIMFDEKEDLSIYGFGSFKHKTAKPKTVRHPSTGELMVIGERDYIKFIPTATK